MLEGGFLADADSGDLALLHLGLAADADDVAVADGGGHAAAMAGEGEVGVPRGGDADVALDVLLSGDGGAAGDGAYERHPRHLRQRLETRRRAGQVCETHEPRGCGVQSGGQLLELGPGQVVDALFQLGDGGFGAVAHPGGQLFLRQAQLLPALPDAAGQIGIGHIGPRFLCGLHDFRCSEDSIAKNLL